MTDSIDTLLSELSSFDYTTASKPQAAIQPQQNVNEENINDYIIKKTGKLIDAGIDAVDELKDYIVQGQNPDEIAALSELISSTTKAIEALNRINLHNKKSITDKELKQMDIQGRKEVASLLPGNNIINNPKLIVASRGEIFKALLENNKTEEDLETIDITPIEEKEQEIK